MYKITVVTPSYNQGNYIADCIESVLQQDYTNFNHIIIDNCSKDSTFSVLEKYNHLMVICEHDNGQSQALNKGILLADGDIICWLNSDDMLADDIFVKLDGLFKDESIDIVYGDSIVIDNIRNKEYINKAAIGTIDDFRFWWRGKVRLHQPSIFFRKPVYEAIGDFREDLHYVMDYEYWSRAVQLYNFKKVDIVFSIQRIHDKAKTYKWHKFYDEKEKVFSMYYKNDINLVREKNKVMAKRYYTLAGSYLRYNWRYSAHMFIKSLLCGFALYLR
jgi:glycosyltransferase involved in cell wall biosynthesis